MTTTPTSGAADLPEPHFGEGRHLGLALRSDAYSVAQVQALFASRGKVPAQQPAQSSAETVGNSGFDYQTAAEVLNGKTVSDEAIRKFVAASRRAHDDRAGLLVALLSVRGELASREAEIALLKNALMDAEESRPSTTAQPAQAAEPVAYLTRNAEGDPAMLFFDEDEASTYCEELVDPTPLYLTPQPVAREPLSAAQKQHIHNETGAGHALICLVESYLLDAHGIKGGQHGTE